MEPLKALRHLEIAAERIRSGPQVSSSEVQALRALSDRVERWRLVYLWEYLQFDAEAEPNRLIGAQQNLSAALRGIGYELRTDLLGPSELAALMAAGEPPNRHSSLETNAIGA